MSVEKCLLHRIFFQQCHIRPPLNLVDSSDFLPLIFMGWDIPGEHPEPLKNNIEFLVFSHFSFIFWCWLLYLGHWAENQ